MSRIDYDLTAIKGVAFDVDGVLSPSTIPIDENGTPQRMVNIKDGYALQLAVKMGLKIAIITGAHTESIALRYRALGISDVYLKASDKLPVLEEWMERRGLSAHEVAFVGDDIPDILSMQNVGLPVAPADAAADVKPVACFITKATGGNGVARELLEEILKAKDVWMTDAEAFGW